MPQPTTCICGFNLSLPSIVFRAVALATNSVPSFQRSSEVTQTAVAPASIKKRPQPALTPASNKKQARLPAHGYVRWVTATSEQVRPTEPQGITHVVLKSFRSFAAGRGGGALRSIVPCSERHLSCVAIWRKRDELSTQRTKCRTARGLPAGKSFERDEIFCLEGPLSTSPKLTQEPWLLIRLSCRRGLRTNFCCSRG